MFKRDGDTIYNKNKTIISLIPAHLKAILIPKPGMEDIDDWEYPAIQAVIAAVELLPHKPIYDIYSASRRAMCPLCGRGPDSTYNTHIVGFAIPEGLHRHLAGSHGVRVCSVFRAATEIQVALMETRALRKHYRKGV